MSLAQDTIGWLRDSAHWSGSEGVPTRVVEHLQVTVVVMLFALAIAIPVGILIGHTGRGVAAAVLVSDGLRALPTLGVVTLVGIWLGIGLTAPVIALVILAIPPPLAGVYAGMRAVDRDVVDTARAIGMTEWGIVRDVELPLAAASVLGGIRSATVQVVATVTVAAYVADAGLGRYIIEGLRTRAYDEMLGGSLLVIALAVVLDAAYALLARVVRPKGSNPPTRRMHAR
jgi:osmoprotectant transport system permease protein